ncbi:NAD-dependent epimerase/dehydratase family protein [Dactylosporangium vinaceum]|uniref:NAD-dependent epimerase/dehydratase family protein n=1 Tax=Dactylosporangium vinaceum TaxID=53362 RepID=A0ABV5M367_9ACTN|nr:NAD-dependent epimerase/dehydratase family protein [Dactylosporangium vinaceum]UAB99780.1 NAD-dependent epimerase/dehydratase family protein [Dactylosporangium vinaceum]
MRALLLGGAGFIGLHLARRLLDDGGDVTIVDDFSRGRNDPDLGELARGPHLGVQHGDLTDPATWRVLPHGWDQIYLLAAVVGVRNVEADPARAVRVNSLAVLHLLDWITAGEHVFFASTSEVYAGAVDAGIAPVPTGESVPVAIGDVTAPRYAYAVSKLLGEAAIIHGARAKHFRAVVGRFHNVYGPRMGTAHAIPELTLRALRGERPLRVPGAEQTRAFCYVDDAVEAIVRLMATSRADGRIVHIGDDTAETGIADLAKLVLRLTGADTEIAPAAGAPGAVTRRCPDLTLLRSLTGYQPAVPLEEGVRRTVEWYRR